MIRVNLLGEKKDMSGVYLLQTIAFCAALTVTVVAVLLHFSETQTQLELAQSQKTLLESNLARLRNKTKKVEELEKKKKLLEEKLMTISKLKARKQGPVRVLDDLTGSIPERAWLRQVSQKSDSVEFAGVALDNQTISHFMVQLEQSKFFQNVDLAYARQYVKDGVKLQQFSLLAQLTDPLKIKPDDAAQAGAETGTALPAVAVPPPAALPEPAEAVGPVSDTTSENAPGEDASASQLVQLRESSK